MDKGNEDAIGKCHICRESPKPVSYCEVCDHWFCGACRGRWWARGLEAVKELVGEKRPGCCGPVAEEE